MKTDLNRLLRILLENEIEFVLVGGFAATVHGSSFVTKDIDICCVLSPAQIENLREVLGPLHPKHRMTPAKLSFLKEPRNLESVRNIYLETDLGILDIISEVAGIGSFEEVKKNSTMISLFGYSCNVISVPALIEAKRAMGRDRDKATIHELLVLQEKTQASVTCEISRFEDLPREVSAFVLASAKREFGNIPIVREHVWAKADWCIWALRNEAILGSVSLVTRTACFDEKSVAVVGINNLIIEPSARKMGIGKILMNKAIEFCFEKLKAEAIVLFCADDLVGYYQQLGFTKVVCPVWIEQPKGRKTWSSNCLVNSKVVMPSRLIDLCGLPW